MLLFLSSCIISLSFAIIRDKLLSQTGDDTNPSSAVEDILVAPEKLRDLDLDAFAEELERQEYGNKRTTLYDIRDELFGPFKERREAYAPLSQVQRSSLL